MMSTIPALVWAQPGFLMLLLLLPWVAFWPRRGEVRHVVIRGVALAALILALAHPISLLQQSDPYPVIVVDASESCGASARRGIEELLQKPFEGRPALLYMGELPQASQLSPDRWRTVQQLSYHPESGSSPLGMALRRAAMLIPDGCAGSVTWVSDGAATDRLWECATEQLTARGIPVHALTLESAVHGPRIVSVEFDAPLHVGATQVAQVTVVGSGAGSDADLQLSLDSAASASLTGGAAIRTTDDLTAVPLRGGGHTVAVPFEPQRSGFIPIVIELREKGTTDAVDQWRSTIAVQDPIRVLYLGDRVAGARDKLQSLLGAGVQLDTLDAPQPGNSAAAPDSDASWLSDYDLVMLDDRPSEKVPQSLQQQLVDRVQQQGMGLLVAGGGGSFGPGGYHETPLEQILPVEFVQKEEKKDPSTALAVVIDTSGSMGGNRIRLAKEVTRLAIKRLLPHDKVGIVEFYGAKRWAAPLQSAANAIDIQRALNRLDAGGGTVLYPALEEAYYGLKNAQTRYKHVLMLTDAGVESGPYESLLRRMARDGICVSTVLVGPERHSEFLVELADWGNGRFYNCSDRFNLPEVMLKQPSTARLPAYRSGTFTVEARGGRGWWGANDPRQTPPIAGYVECRARVGAEVLLRTESEGHPVLASWRHGLGRVTAMMTEPTGKGTEPWRQWPDYGGVLARIISRTAERDTFPYRVRLQEEGARLRFVAQRHRLDAPALSLQRWVVANSANAANAANAADADNADGTNGGGREFRDVPLQKVATGGYAATLWRSTTEEVRLMATAGNKRWRIVSSCVGAGVGTEATPALAGGIVSETHVDPRTSLPPALLAECTGGDVISAESLRAWTPTSGEAVRPWSSKDRRPLLLLLALLLFLADIAYRRNARWRPHSRAA